MEVVGHARSDVPERAAMTVDEGMPSIGTLSPADVEDRSPAPVVHADPEGPPEPPPPASPEEILAVRDMVTRLMSTWPSVAEAVIEATVRSAYDSFRQARVRAYVPILVERRARKVLRAAAEGSPAGGSDR